MKEKKLPAEYEIPIDGKIVICKPRMISIEDIEFDEFNPRISMARDSEISGTGIEHIDQKMLAYFLKTQASYSDLKSSILHSGGATIPIWVYPISDKKYRVIEGNTRLLIHTELSVEDKKFKKINCIVLPTEIDEEVKDHIRLICHLRGHTDWDRYEQAKYLFSLYENEKHPVKALAELTKLSKSEILEDIEAYKIMTEQFKTMYGENEIVHKFSYFKEFVKNRKLRNAMSELKLTENDFCDWVGKRKIGRAMDVRKLESVLRPRETRELFLKKDLDKALDLLRDLVPEKSEKVFIMMAGLSERIGAIQLNDIEDIRTKKSKKRKIVEELYDKLGKLLR